MGVELVTAYTGTNHVSSSQDGALYAGIVGLDNYVFTTGQQLQATMEDANTLVVASGNGLINGRHFEVTDTVSFTIPTGSQDMMTSNLAVIRYTKGADSVESVTPLVLTGEPVAENPQDPSYNKGSILDGVSTVDFPIYRIVTTGISAADPVQLFDVVDPLAKASAQLSGAPLVRGGTKTLSSWTASSTAGRYYSIVLTASEVQSLIGRPYDPERDAFVAMSAQSNRSASIEVATVNEYGNLYAYASGNPTSMQVSWVLVAG